MKWLLTLTVIIVSQFAQAQNTEMIASTAGIGPFRIGMSKAAVEKLLATKLNMPKNKKDPDGYDWDTIKCKYKELELELVFGKTYFGNDTAARLGIYYLSSNWAGLKTKSGIGVGDDKLKIFKTYDQYRLHYYPDFDRKSNPGKAEVNLFDNDTSNVLIFYLNNGIITGFGAMIYEGD